MSKVLVMPKNAQRKRLMTLIRRAVKESDMYWDDSAVKIKVKRMFGHTPIGEKVAKMADAEAFITGVDAKKNILHFIKKGDMEETVYNLDAISDIEFPLKKQKNTKKADEQAFYA